MCVCAFVRLCVYGRVRAQVYAQLTHAKLVIAVLGDVSHPWQGLVPALFHDLEIPHLPRCRCVSDSSERCRGTVTRGGSPPPGLAHEGVGGCKGGERARGEERGVGRGREGSGLREDGWEELESGGGRSKVCVV